MIQRRVFPLVAFAVAVAAMFGLRLPVAAEVVVLAVSVLLLGIPHGALDVLHARDAQQLQRPAQWARFLLRYVAIALLVVAVWTIAPSASLVGLTFYAQGVLYDPSPAGGPTFGLTGAYELVVGS